MPHGLRHRSGCGCPVASYDPGHQKPSLNLAIWDHTNSTALKVVIWNKPCTSYTALQSIKYNRTMSWGRQPVDLLLLMDSSFQGNSAAYNIFQSLIFSAVHERHGILHYLQNDWLFSIFSGSTKKTWKLRIISFFKWKIHRQPVVSPHKGPVIHKAFPCHDVTLAAYFQGNFDPSSSPRLPIYHPAYSSVSRR